ncbi:hypothetical protein NLI96_g1114 [Meripilus lineatus]|uniref:DUF6818 domain-containing protein n=1 Tax=Meripilus lineatus TaxID=2056292 RepID=A0AAD5VB56_9APHY|nr:hypothetical protein NLI96_g1114 [Physisporinus lineatus]
MHHTHFILTHSPIHLPRIPLALFEPSSDEDLPENLTPLRRATQADSSQALDVKPVISKSSHNKGKQTARKGTTKDLEAKNSVKTPSSGGPSRGQKRAHSPPPSAPVKRGRANGASGYTEADLTVVFRLLRKYTPIGSAEWVVVVSEFNSWAKQAGRPERGVKPLQSKFWALVRTAKPTGNRQAPWHIQEAWAINELLDKRACTRPIDDSAIDGGDDDFTCHVDNEIIEIFDSSDDDDVHKVESPSLPTATGKLPKAQPQTASTSKKSQTATGPIVTKNTRPSAHTSRSSNNELITNLTSTFDPNAQAAREDARNAQRTQAAIMEMMAGQVRDLSSRTQILQDQVAEERRRADRAEDELRMLRLLDDRLGGISSRPLIHNSAPPTPAPRTSITRDICVTPSRAGSSNTTSLSLATTSPNLTQFPGLGLLSQVCTQIEPTSNQPPNSPSQQLEPGEILDDSNVIGGSSSKQGPVE